MRRNISRHTKLLVVSDTGMVKTSAGYRAFGPVVKELDHLLNEFDEITWIGFDKKNQRNNLSYTLVRNKRIKLILLKDVGGASMYHKLAILFQYPLMLWIILREIWKHPFIHTRAPSNPAVIAMLLSFFFPKKTFWHKYAGTWEDKASFFYEVQRSFLKILNKNSLVTINGQYEKKNPRFFSFENPCLDHNDRILGQQIIDEKKRSKSPVFCFVGNLTKNKGVDILIDTLKAMNLSKISHFYFVGSSLEQGLFEEQAKESDIEVSFLGFLNKNEIIKVYSKSDFIVLPSLSEGFPKVIGEAMNYGCIPIVSNISCISDYVVDGTNGFLINPITKEQVKVKIEESLLLSNSNYKAIIQKNYILAEKFTYEYYNNRLVTEIFK